MLRAVGLALVAPCAWAQLSTEDTIELTAAASASGAVKTGSFSDAGDSATFTVSAPAGSTLDFVVELGDVPASSSVSNIGVDEGCRGCSSPSPPPNVWLYASVEVAAGDSAMSALNCGSEADGVDAADTSVISNGVGGIQLAGIVETTWTFRVTYTRPPYYNHNNNACSGKCTDDTFMIADQSGYEPPYTQRSCADLSAPLVADDPSFTDCSDTMDAQPWRVTVAATPRPVVEALDAPDSGDDGAAVSWQADPAWTDKDWHYISSDLTSWPTAGSTESEQLKASFAFKGDNAGMMVMAEYDRPPTETRVVGYSQPHGSNGYYFSTAFYNGVGPPAPSACETAGGNTPPPAPMDGSPPASSTAAGYAGCDGSNQFDIQLTRRDADSYDYKMRNCRLVGGALASAYEGRNAADEGKVFIAMRVVEGSSMPATPMVKLDYGTYCNANNGNLCTYHWVSMFFQIVAVVGVGVGFKMMQGKQQFELDPAAPWVGDCADKYLRIVLWAHLVATIGVCLVPLFGWFGFPVIALWGMVYYPGAIMHNNKRMVIYTVFQFLGLLWWFFGCVYAFAIAWGGFHGGFALVLFFCSLLNWLTCALGLIAGVIVLACSKPPVLQAVEMKDVQVAAD